MKETHIRRCAISSVIYYQRKNQKTGVSHLHERHGHKREKKYRVQTKTRAATAAQVLPIIIFQRTNSKQKQALAGLFFIFFLFQSFSGTGASP